LKITYIIIEYASYNVAVLIAYDRKELLCRNEADISFFDAWYFRARPGGC
jgi:hypothetical protein